MVVEGSVSGLITCYHWQSSRGTHLPTALCQLVRVWRLRSCVRHSQVQQMEVVRTGLRHAIAVPTWQPCNHV